MNNSEARASETATLAGGCFWCTETLFLQLKGIKSVVSGYAGGKKENPTYSDAHSRNTGEAESIQIEFGPEVLSYADLLEVFLKTHDPTTLNRQGADVGPEYRSAIFYHSDEQKTIAEKAIRELEDAKYFQNPIITQILPFTSFYQAETYHQDFYKKNPNSMYCMLVIDPKIQKLKKQFKEKVR